MFFRFSWLFSGFSGMLLVFYEIYCRDGIIVEDFVVFFLFVVFLDFLNYVIDCVFVVVVGRIKLYVWLICSVSYLFIVFLFISLFVYFIACVFGLY